MSNFDLAWFAEGFVWGHLDRRFILAAVNLRSYTTNESFKCISNDQRIHFRCINETGCPGELLFSRLQKLGWRVKKMTAHTQVCTLQSADLDFLHRRWLNCESKIPTIVLADMVRPVLSARLIDQSSLQPLQVAAILKEKQLLPPFWDTRPNAEVWLHSLSFAVCEHIRDNPRELVPTSSLSAKLSQQNDSPGTELDFLSSFIEHYELLDPDNKVELVTRTQRDAELYVAAFLILGPIKRMATSATSTMQFEMDGSHFKSGKRRLRCPGFIRGIVYQDGNGMIHPLLVAHESRGETEEAYTDLLNTFFALFTEDQRRNIGIATDRDLGIIAAMSQLEKQHQCGWTFCHVHIKRNVHVAFAATDKDKAVQLFQSVALASTVEGSVQMLARAEQQMPELVEYLADIPEQRWIRARFPVQRVGTTTNAVEAFWADIGRQELREINNVATFFLRVYRLTLKKLAKAKRDSALSNDGITAWATARLGMLKNVASHLDVADPDGWKVVVCDSYSRRYLVDLQARSCPCQTRQIHPIVCKHLLAAARYFRADNNPLTLTAECYFQTHWLEGLEASKPWNPYIHVHHEDERANNFARPSYSEGKGRKAKAKRRRTDINGTKKRGKLSVFARTMGIDSDAVELQHPSLFFARPPQPPPPQAPSCYNAGAASQQLEYGATLPEGIQLPANVNRGDLDSLKGCLTDQVICWALGKIPINSRILIKDTFFLPLARERVTFPLHLEETHQMIILPIHQPARHHWVLMLVFPSVHRILTLDSLSTSTSANEKDMAILRPLLTTQVPKSRGKWTFSEPPVPQQTNSIDCGIFLIVFAEFVAQRSMETNIQRALCDEFFTQDEFAELLLRATTKRLALWNSILEASVMPSPPLSDNPPLVSSPPSYTTRSVARKSLDREARPNCNKRLRNQSEKKKRKK